MPEFDDQDSQSNDVSIRSEYESHGVEQFYARSGAAYRNPHEPVLRRLLKTVASDWILDLSHILDLAAGSGEVTLILADLGAGTIEACDPFTQAAYFARTGRAPQSWSFDDIAAGVLADRRYSLVVCSFALHLCEETRLAGVAFALAMVSPALLILTPHKRPVLRAEWGWALERETVIERVRGRLYRSTFLA